MPDEIEYVLRDITSTFLAVGSVLSLLSFAQGLTAHSFNSIAFSAFCGTWLVLNALVGQIELEAKKILVSLGVPASVATFGIASLLFAASL